MCTIRSTKYRTKDSDGFHDSLRKLLTFGDATTGFPSKWRLRNERRNSPWWCVTTQIWVLLLIGRASWEFDSTNQKLYLWVVTRHQYGISTLVFQTSFGEETCGRFAKCRLQAILRRNSTSYSVSNVFAAGCLIEVFFKEGEFHTSALYPYRSG